MEFIYYSIFFMKRIQEYRKAALEYLLSRVERFTDIVDNELDYALRIASGLPLKPTGHDNYNGLLGMKPVVEQRKQCIRLLKQRLDEKASSLQIADTIIDKAIRLLNSLPERPKGRLPYEALFVLPKKKKNSCFKEASEYSVSKTGIDLIHSFESYRECTYKDPGSRDGLPITGGWGSTRLNGKPLQLGQCYSKEVWDKQFEKDLAYFESAIKKHVSVSITQGMYDALVSFVYNIGVGGFSTSTCLRRLNAGNYKGAAEALTWWNKGGDGTVLKGLVRRRTAEANLFLGVK